MRITAIGAVLVALTTGCKKSEEATAAREVPALTPMPGLASVDVDAGAGARTPNVAVGRDGTVMLTWQEDGGATPVVRGRRRAIDGTWAKTTTLATDDALLVNWADFPVAMPFGDAAVTTYLRKFDRGSGYGVQYRVGVDAGASWSDPAPLHLDESGPEYGFVSMTPIADDRLAVFWVDGRASQGHDGGAMQLRAAELAADGTISARRVVDERICDCCQTAAATTSAGPVVVYRDRSEQEVRDIALAGPKPDQRRRVGADNWTIAGCPVNGPAVAASDAGLVVAWYTGAGEEPSVRVGFASVDGDFGSPVDVDFGQPLGRVDVAWLDDTRALVSFVETLDANAGTAALVARLVARDGTLGAPWKVADVPASNAAGFPRVARTGDRLVWAWTQADGDGTTIGVAEVPIAGLRAS